MRCVQVCVFKIWLHILVDEYVWALFLYFLMIKLIILCVGAVEGLMRVMLFGGDLSFGVIDVRSVLRPRPMIHGCSSENMIHICD